MPNPEKAYKNLDFLNSKAARTVRILCEYEEPKARFEAEGVENTIVMFGSARIRSEAESAETLESAKAARADGSCTRSRTAFTNGSKTARRASVSSANASGSRAKKAAT